MPWGISESAYDLVDRHDNYQYKAFGVPGLGLKRGLGGRAGGGALRHRAGRAGRPRPRRRRTCAGSRREGLRGRLRLLRRRRLHAASQPTTPGRRRPGPRRPEGAIVRTYLAHHQGMTLVGASPTRCTATGWWSASTPTRASRPPSCSSRSASPRHAAFVAAAPGRGGARRAARAAGGGAPLPLAAHRLPARPVPLERQLHRGGDQRRRRRELLPRAAPSPGRARTPPATRAASSSTCATCAAAGSGRPRTTRPRAEAEDDLVTFAMEKATFHRREDEIGTQLDVAVSPEDDVEVRRLVVTNHSDRAREIEVTSYAEIVLAPPADDLAHPAFGKLFVESEYVPESAALLCRRRPRAPDDAELFARARHQPGGPDAGAGGVGDRPRRASSAAGAARRTRRRSTGGRSPAPPASCSTPSSACGSGSASRPAGVARLSFATGMATEPGDGPGAGAALPRPQRHGPDLRARLRARAEHAPAPRHLQRGGPPLRAPRLARALRRRLAARRPGARWPATPSGRRGSGRTASPATSPSCSCAWSRTDDLALVRQVLQAQEYWRLKGLSADVVILNEHPVSYLDEVHGAARRRCSTTGPGGPGSTGRAAPTSCARDRMPEAERLLLSGGGARRPDRRPGRRWPSSSTGPPAAGPSRPSRSSPAAGARGPAPSPAPAPRCRRSPSPTGSAASPTAGGSTSSSSRATQETPLPWVNVIANPGFGTIVTASGSAFTWSENSRENRLTPFANDPVTDPTAEAIFVRDDETGEAWSPTPGPLPAHRDERPLRGPPRGRGHPLRARGERHPARRSTSSWTRSTR